MWETLALVQSQKHMMLVVRVRLYVYQAIKHVLKPHVVEHIAAHTVILMNAINLLADMDVEKNVRRVHQHQKDKYGIKPQKNVV
jgi:hypothetical protein